MTSALGNINGHLTIDGNTIQSENMSRDQVVITGKNMVINDRSSFIFHNVLVQLSGKIIVKGKIKPVLFDSYILCKDAGNLSSASIIEVDDFDNVVIGKVDYIKKLPNNAEIWIYDLSGRRVFKGSKSEANKASLPISRYDVKVVGESFESKVLFY